MRKLFQELKQKVQGRFSSQQLQKEVHENFFVKSYKFRRFSFSEAAASFEKLCKRYEENLIEGWPSEWHKYQRKLFIEILIWYCKINKTIPPKMSNSEWEYLSELYFDKNPMFLKFQGLSMLKIYEKCVWEASDDQKLTLAVQQMGEGNWNEISKKIFFQSKCMRFIAPKQCRERWFNHLSNKISRDGWTDQEDLIILKHVFEKNRRWCQIVKVLNNTRTQHMVKNRFMRVTRNKFKENSKKQVQFIGHLIKKIENKIGRPQFTEFSNSDLELNEIKNQTEQRKKQKATDNQKNAKQLTKWQRISSERQNQFVQPAQQNRSEVSPNNNLEQPFFQNLPYYANQNSFLIRSSSESLVYQWVPIQSSQFTFQNLMGYNQVPANSQFMQYGPNSSLLPLYSMTARQYPNLQ